MVRRTSASKVAWSGEARDTSLSSLFSSMRDKACIDLGTSVSIGTEGQANLVGLPLSALSLRYLFQSSVFPLSRLIQFTGEEGSAKSALMYELFRWHMAAGGGAILAENENKDSPEMRNSILEWRSQYLERMVVKPTFSLEQWQDVFTTFIDIARKQQDAPDGPGRTVPVVFAVDSIMATASESEIKSVREDGHASRGYALAANLISRYMRCVPELIQDYPFTVAGTNHLKPGTDARGFPTTAIPGGKSVKFMETYEIEMRRTERSDIDLMDYGGLRVKITARKNSLGPSRKSITAELLWWNDDRDGTYRQRTMWDWHAATIELLLSFENAKGKKTFYNALMDICDIRKKAGALAYSKTLGISADDAIPFRQLGYELECRPELLSQLHRLLGVAERQPFIPGMDYRTLAEAARARAAEEARQQYGAAENVQQLVAADITDDDDAEERDSYGDDELPEV